jgi:threonylcarbamoyladenosine tRNA methylthiotransferase MtaB
MISRPEKEVLSEIRNLVKNGCPEIVLTGVRLGKYDKGLESLIKKILDIPGVFRVRLSSLELREVTDGLIKLTKDNPERICSHLHLPLQSGSDKILKRMGRPYTAGEFTRRVKEITKVLPDIAVSTDIIVGFPGETDTDFEDTYNMAKVLGFSRLHVFRYSRRECTAACSFKDNVPAEKVKARSSTLRELDKKLQKAFWKKFIGTIRQVVPEGDKNTLLSDNYIRLGTDIKTHSFCSKIINVEITDNSARPWGIIK